ncbi:hypothetical protein M0654_12465 [Rhizobium sp. NTR19]|uniref:Uncharacterized protein n=1 Tax=Neorhizobium turbinariae TaxID=2937795 RepID=A0ABT0ISH7_9HYPH|nr:hypothetical protein [Neorhizobium turbinariae]MCK8780798.1 hypothetical protein [Neorhizobium turbinariae]
MPARPNEWSRGEAEKAIRAVFDAAKTGETQMVIDFDGTFEIRFVRPRVKQRTNEFLAQGGPLDE